MTEIVRALVYRVVWAHDVDYERAPRVHIEKNDFDLDLFGRELRATLKREYSTIEQARTHVENYLRSWEIFIGISGHPNEVQFVYEQAEVDEVKIDPETGQYVRQVKTHIEASANLLAVLHVSRGKYPQPVPADSFHVDSVVEALYSRYARYSAGRELLTSMAYFCLTVIERSAGSRKEVVRKYRIAKAILDNLGRLCSERGSKEEARKARKKSNPLPFIPLSKGERQWILAAVKLLIRRAGEIAAYPDETLGEITLQDLPDLEDLP
jgi:hypothetical protein